MQAVSAAEASAVIAGVQGDCRRDGRRRIQWRPLSIQTQVAPSTVGSAAVQLDGTHVVVGISGQIAEVDGADSESPAPYVGRLQIAVDISPSVTISGAIAVGPRGGELDARTGMRRELLSALLQLYDAQEIGATAGSEDAGVSGQLQASALDLSCLSVGEGRYWQLFVDVSVLSAAGGSVLAASAAAIKAALMTSRIPQVTVTRSGEGDVTVDVLAEQWISHESFRHAPLVVSLALFPGYYVVDPSLLEHSAALGAAHFGVHQSGKVCSSSFAAVRGGRGLIADSAKDGEGGFLVASTKDFPVLLEEAVTHADGVHAHFFEVLELSAA